MNTFEQKVVIITGGTSGIGRATAIAFAKEGATVVVSGRRESEGLESVKLIEEAGGRGLFVPTDVEKEEDLKNLVATTVDTFGRLDIAFNNAGIHLGATPLLETTGEQYDKVLDINVRGALFAMKYEIAAMLESGGGVVVNNASVLGLRPLPGTGIYNASKAAIISLTKSSALEFATQGVRINVVCPAVIETEMTASLREDDQVSEHIKALHPMNRYGKVSEVAAAVLYLSSDDAGYSTGVVLTVDGGYAI